MPAMSTTMPDAIAAGDQKKGRMALAPRGRGRGVGFQRQCPIAATGSGSSVTRSAIVLVDAGPPLVCLVSLFVGSYVRPVPSFGDTSATCDRCCA